MLREVTTSQILHSTWFIWLALIAIWIGTGSLVKRAAFREPMSSRIDHIGPIAVGLYFIFGPPIPFLPFDYRLYNLSPLIAFGGMLAVLVGGLFSTWARLSLGANWSAVAEIKEDHVLVVRGPYRLVRHPIYAGFLLCVIGSAAQHGLTGNIIGVGICIYGLALKVKVEERFMIHRFGERYLEYSRQVKAIPPFIW